MRSVSRLSAALAFCVIVAGAIPETRAQTTPGGWTTFEGQWSARGQRRTIRADERRLASIISVSGAVVFSRGTSIRGFLGEAIGFHDGAMLSVGRAVWTDERGDQVFSELKGEPIATGSRIAAVITGGTGRYAGITGEYQLTWQWVVTEDDNWQGRATDLKGRFRRESR